MKRLTTIAVLAVLVTGCTTFHVQQTDSSKDQRIISSDIKATAFFSSAQNIAQIKALQNDKTQSFGASSLGQQGATNTVEALKAIDSILGKIHP